MYNVSWFEATEFCEKLSTLTGVKVNLPTEAQWEYACRAGTTTPFSFGTVLNGDKANCHGNVPYGTRNKGPNLERTTNVRSYPPNAWGLYDMHGNVWEWCEDWIPYNYTLFTHPNGPKFVQKRFQFHRSGSWRSTAEYCRSTSRGKNFQESRENHLGFRPVLSSSGKPNSFKKRTDEQSVLSAPGSEAGEGRYIDIKGIRYTFRWCPPGKFMMGSPESEKGRYPQEAQHEVTLTKGFWLLETEVTQAMWKSVMGNNPSLFSPTGGGKNGVTGSTDQYPVESVSWIDCQIFITMLNVTVTPVPGFRFSLPSEAQWEYACRAGTTGEYGGTGDLYDMGWCRIVSGERTHEVKSKVPNAWNLYDMHGNVYEWCNDWYGDYPRNNVTDPTGLKNGPFGPFRVIRGGSWRDDVSACRSAYRFYSPPESKLILFGFRLALSPLGG